MVNSQTSSEFRLVVLLGRSRPIEHYLITEQCPRTGSSAQVRYTANPKEKKSVIQHTQEEYFNKQMIARASSRSPWRGVHPRIASTEKCTISQGAFVNKAAKRRRYCPPDVALVHDQARTLLQRYACKEFRVDREFTTQFRFRSH